MSQKEASPSENPIDLSKVTTLFGNLPEIEDRYSAKSFDPDQRHVVFSRYNTEVEYLVHPDINTVVRRERINALSPRNREKLSRCILEIPLLDSKAVYQLSSDSLRDGKCNISIFTDIYDDLSPFLIVRYEKGMPQGIHYPIPEIRTDQALEFQRNNPDLPQPDLIKKIYGILRTPAPGFNMPRLKDYIQDVDYLQSDGTVRFSIQNGSLRTEKYVASEKKVYVSELPAQLPRQVIQNALHGPEWYLDPTIMSVSFNRQLLRKK